MGKTDTKTSRRIGGINVERLMLFNCARCSNPFYRSRPSANREIYCSLSCRVWSHVNTNTDPKKCWPWASLSHHYFGYGMIRVGGRTVTAHRAIWEISRGPIPAGMLVCHMCDNPACCNPEHLFLGTAKDNALDMMRKGRHWSKGKTLSEAHRQVGRRAVELETIMLKG